MTASRQVVDLLRVQADAKIRLMAAVAETVADHARKYSGIEMEKSWVDDHVALMTGRGPVSALPRTTPMVAAPSLRDAEKQGMKADFGVGSDGRRQSPDAPPLPLPPSRRPWVVRNFAVIGAVVVIVAMIGVLYWQNATGWAFLIMVPALTAASIQRHAYRRRIDELAQSVVTEAQYMSRYFPRDYPQYLREAKIALHERGADRFIARLPSR